jgi:hypothetical protein
MNGAYRLSGLQDTATQRNLRQIDVGQKTGYGRWQKMENNWQQIDGIN